MLFTAQRPDRTRARLLIATVTALAIGTPALPGRAAAMHAQAAAFAGRQQATLGNGLVGRVSVAAHASIFRRPLDSTPDSAGTTIYFTATGAQDTGVFRVPVNGGPVQVLITGAPFVAPRGIAISPDDRSLFIADPGAGGAAAKGGIFAMPPDGGAARMVAGSAGTAPENMDVVMVGGKPVIYFTGRDPRNGRPGVFRLPAAGGKAPAIVAEGDPFVAPDGVAVTRSGAIYVADRAAAGNGFGRIFMLAGGALHVIVPRVHTGNPGGIALNLDQSLLLVSAHQAARAARAPDEVLVVDLRTRKTGAITTGISHNVAAGGVHRAASQNILSWADLTAGGAGTVYRIEIK